MVVEWVVVDGDDGCTMGRGCGVVVRLVGCWWLVVDLIVECFVEMMVVVLVY